MSNTTAQTEIPVSEGTLLLIGPILIGALFSWCLFGISIVQLYIYYLSFRSDPRILRASVYGVFILDTFQSVVVAFSSWHTLCSGWGRPSALEFPGWTFVALPIVTGLISMVVQFFFAFRIYSLGRWYWIPCSIVVLALAQSASAMAIGIGFIPLKDIVLLHKPDMFARTIIWLGGAALADLVIAVSMFYLLYSAKKNVAFKHTEQMITRLIRITVETGAITATSATLELILFRTSSTTNLHFTIALMLSKIYSNAFMACLNSRLGSRVKKRSVNDSMSLPPVSTVRFGNMDTTVDHNSGDSTVRLERATSEASNKMHGNDTDFQLKTV